MNLMNEGVLPPNELDDRDERREEAEARKPETIADIIAKKRRRASELESKITAYKDNPSKDLALETLALSLVAEDRNEADRLDVAHKRELDALNEQITDLRQQRDLWSKRAAELVEKCNEQYAKLKRGVATTKKSLVVGNAAKLREAVVEIIDYLEPIRKWTMPSKENHTRLTALFAAVDTVYTKAKSALAAPPRNCDVYDNESCRMAYHLHGPGLMTMQAFADWLYAPATEKEGGAK